MVAATLFGTVCFVGLVVLIVRDLTRGKQKQLAPPACEHQWVKFTPNGGYTEYTLEKAEESKVDVVCTHCGEVRLFATNWSKRVEVLRARVKAAQQGEALPPMTAGALSEPDVVEGEWKENDDQGND